MLKGFALTLILVVISQLCCQLYAQPAVAPFFRNSQTKFNFTRGGSRCGGVQPRCVRKAYQDLTQTEKDLFARLFIEATRRQWIEAMSTEHNYDCQFGTCQFHQQKNFLPWHRFYLTHLEQILQKTDGLINPGRAARDGPFCLAYWDWGYQSAFSNDFTSSAYSYIFAASGMGTLRNGANSIPDGLLRNLQAPPNSGNLVRRDPSLGSNNWDNGAMAACLNLRDLEGGGDGRFGFRPCFEGNTHNSVHNAIGNQFASFQAPRDPLFFLHHGGVDYIWAVWQSRGGNTLPPGWSTPMVRPYNNEGWVLQDTIPYNQLCYSYQPPRNRVKKLKSLRKFLQANNDTTPTDVNALPGDIRTAVRKNIDQPTPQPIPYERFTFLRMHSSSEAEARRNYNNHVRAVGLAQELQLALKSYFKGTLSRADNNTFQPEVLNLPQFRSFAANNRQTQDVIKNYLSVLSLTP